ncbi:hypothetical protein ALT721_1200001 [Alteromonas alvinellae]
MHYFLINLQQSTPLTLVFEFLFSLHTVMFIYADDLMKTYILSKVTV